MRLVKQGPMVSIEITTQKSPDGDWYNQVEEIIREDANGSRAVRVSEATLIDGTHSGRTLVHDYEPAHGPVNYYARILDEATQRASIQFALLEPVLHSVTRPDLYATISILSDVQRSRELSVPPSSTPAGTWAFFNGAAAHAGKITLTIDADTYPQARELEALFVQNSPLMLRQPDHAGLDCYLHATSCQIKSQRPNGKNTLWQVILDAVEIDFPPIEAAELQSTRFGTYEEADNQWGRIPYYDVMEDNYSATYGWMRDMWVWWI